MIRFIILLLALSLASCATKKKAEKYYRNNPLELAKICSETYPPKVEYRPGKPIVSSDTVVVRDSVLVEIEVDCPDGTVVKADCPPAEKIYVNNIVTVTDTAYVINTARVEYLEGTLAVKEADIIMLEMDRDNWKRKASSRLRWSIVLGLIVGVRILWYFRGLIRGG